MAEYEVVREVQNLCGNNQMRDVFFAEIETDDPVSWVRGFLKGKDVELTVDEKACNCQASVIRYFCIESMPDTRRHAATQAIYFGYGGNYERSGHL